MIVGFGNGYAQNVSDSLLVEFFNKTFNDYFSERNDLKKEYYIVKDSSMPDGVTTDYANFKLHFIDYWGQVCSLIKEDEAFTLFWAESRRSSVNTIDIFIDENKIFSQKKGRKKRICYYNIEGGVVILSVGRLIYDYQSEEWNYKSMKKHKN